MLKYHYILQSLLNKSIIMITAVASLTLLFAVHSGTAYAENHTHILLESTMEFSPTDTDLFGASIADIGDVDGDGTTDIAVGAPGHLIHRLSAGDLYILFMNPNGTVRDHVVINGEDHEDLNISVGDHFGQSVANIGDLDNDGINEIAVGAPAHLVGDVGTGDLYILYLNSDGTVKNAVEINGETPNGPALENHDLFGHSVANIGDLDNNGINDIAVGAPDHPVNGVRTGTVYVILLNAEGGAISTVEINAMDFDGLDSLEADDKFGHSIAGIGDLNRDGIEDMVVGAPGHLVGDVGTGDLYVLYMNADGTVQHSAEINAQTHNGPDLGDQDLFGHSVGNVGDFDGDGINEIAVGAPGHLVGDVGTGDLYVLYMNTDGSIKRTAEINGNTPNGPELDQQSLFGSAVSSIGDLNGDGWSDLAIGGSNTIYLAFTAPHATITGTVFSDVNSNGMQDAGEPGISNHMMLAINYETQAIYEAHTDPNGMYTFGIMPGMTTLVQTHYYPNGHILSTDNWYNYVMPADASITQFDIGFHPVQEDEFTTLDLTVFLDENFNGMMDANESGIEGLVLTAYTYTIGPATIVTDSNGMVSTNLVPADWAINDLPAGYLPTVIEYMRSDSTVGKMYDPSLLLVDDPEPGSSHTMTIGLRHSLLAEQLAWLASNPTINVAYEPSWPPIEYVDDDGNLSGLTALYMQEFESFTGADFVQIPIENWADALASLQDGRADVVMMIENTPAREEFLLFTEPHSIVPLDLITRAGNTVTPEQLSDLEIATVTGYAIEGWLERDYPEASYTSYDHPADALMAVSNGRADVYIEAWAVSSYLIDENSITGLTSSGPSGYTYNLTMGVDIDQPILASIITKALESISEEDRQEMLDRVLSMTP